MECGGCTECCTAFPVLELDKPAWRRCEYCVGEVCIIYPTRPESCRGCECSYMQMENCGLELRPDKCGIIFEKEDSSTFVGTIVGRTTQLAKQQVREFKKQGFEVRIQVRKL